MEVRKRKQNTVQEAETKPSSSKPTRQASSSSFSIPSYAGIFLVSYYIVAIICMRYHLRGAIGLYDAFWNCNTALLISALGCFYRNNRLISIAMTMIAFHHLLFAVDALTFFATGAYPLGVAAYLSWPETSWLEILTTLHHVWFIPLNFYVLHKIGKPVTWYGWVGSAFMTLIAGCLARLFTDKIVYLSDGTPYYLNLNNAHEMWKDVPIPALHIYDDAPFLHYLVFLFFVGNFLLNIPVFLMLRGVSRLVLEKK